MAKNKKEMTPEERLAAALVPEEEQPYELPEGWKWVYLGKITTIVGGGTPSSRCPEYYDGGLIPWITPADLSDYTEVYISHGRRNITQLGLEKSSAKLMPENTVLLSSRAPIGYVAIAANNVCTNQGFKSFLPSIHFLPKYLYWFLKGNQPMLQQYASGTTFLELSSKRASEIRFPIAPLSEQQRLVARIESLFAKLDAAKAKVQAVLDAHETRKAALLHEAIAGDLIGAGEKELKPLSEIVDLIRIGPFGSALHKEDYIQGGIPVVNPQHIVNQVICPDSRKSISESKADSLAVYKMCVNDIIIGRRGEMGRTAPVGEDEAGWLCGTGCMLLRLKKEYDAKFYSLVIASQKSKQYLETHAVGSTMKNLNEKIIRNLPVPVYSYAEQQEIVAILDRLLGREEEVRQSAESVLAAIDSMKQSILAQAFHGELGA